MIFFFSFPDMLLVIKCGKIFSKIGSLLRVDATDTKVHPFS